MKRFWILGNLLLALSLVSLALAADAPAPAAPAATAATPASSPGVSLFLPPAPVAVAPWLQGIAVPDASQTCPCLACSHIGLICCHPPSYQCGCADDVSQCTPF